MDHSTSPRTAQSTNDPSEIGPACVPRPASPFCTVRRRTPGLQDQYLRPAVEALIKAISFRVKQGASEFTISANSQEFENTSLGHLRTNDTYDKICNAVITHIGQMGFVVEISTEQDLESGLILRYTCKIEHAYAKAAVNEVEGEKEETKILNLDMKPVILD